MVLNLLKSFATGKTATETLIGIANIIKTNGSLEGRREVGKKTLFVRETTEKQIKQKFGSITGFINKQIATFIEIVHASVGQTPKLFAFSTTVAKNRNVRAAEKKLKSFSASIILRVVEISIEPR